MIKFMRKLLAMGALSILLWGAVLPLHARADLASDRASAQSLASESRYEEALKAYDLVFKHTDLIAADYWNRGWSYYGVGQREEALLDIQKAATLAPTNAEYHGDVVYLLIDTYRYRDAVNAATAGMKLFPDHTYFQRYRGLAQYYLSVYAESLADYDAAIAKDATQPRWWNERGRVHDAMYNFEKALADYSMAIDLAPGEADYFIDRGRAHNYEGRSSDALDDFEIALSIRRDAPTLILKASALRELNRNDEYKATVAEAVALAPDAYQVMVAQANLLREDNDYLTAEQVLKKAIALHPREVSPKYYLGLTRMDRLMPASAYALFKTVEPKWSEHAVLQQKMGQALLDQGLYERALPHFAKALSLDPNFPAALEDRAFAQIRLGNYKEAIADSEAAMAKDAKRTVPFFRRAYAYRQLGEKDKALEDYNTVLRLDPDYRAALEERAEFHLENNRIPEARKDIEAALKLPRVNADTHRVLGRVEEYEGKYEDAIKTYSKALAEQSNNVWLYEDRAWAHMLAGHSSEALEDCDRLISYRPGRPEGYRCRAKTFEKFSNFELALKELQQAIKIDKTYLPAQFDMGYNQLAVRDYEGAIQNFSNLISQKYRLAESFYYRGSAHEEKSDWQAAERDYSKALELADPTWAATVSQRLNKAKARLGSDGIDAPLTYPQARSFSRD